MLLQAEFLRGLLNNTHDRLLHHRPRKLRVGLELFDQLVGLHVLPLGNFCDELRRRVLHVLLQLSPDGLLLQQRGQ